MSPAIVMITIRSTSDFPVDFPKRILLVIGVAFDPVNQYRISDRSNDLY